MICVAPSASMASGVEKENNLDAVVVRDQEGVSFAVTTEHERVADERGRTAVAVHGRVLKRGLMPQNFPGEIKCRRAHVAEVNINTPVTDDRSWAGKTVLLVYLLGGVRIRFQDLDVPLDTASVRVYAKRAERSVGGLDHGGGEIDFPVHEHG
jgi:hypothetical protein